MSSSNCCFLTCYSRSFSRGRSGGLVCPSLSEFSTVYCDPHSQRLWHNQAEIDVFLELPCFFDDPADVGNLISGSTDFSKTSLNIREFTVHVLLKPGLENFEHYFTSMWDEYNCMVVWTIFGIALLWNRNENWSFPVLWPLWVFQICWNIECSSLTASSFRIWNSSTGIPSPPWALFIVMFPKDYLPSHSRMSGSRWVIIPLWLSGSWRSFFVFCIFITYSFKKFVWQFHICSPIYTLESLAIKKPFVIPVLMWFCN